MTDSNLQTQRTVLRMFTPDDLDALAAIFGNANVMKYLGLDCKPIAREETETAILSMIKHWKERNFGRWAVINKEDKRLIGCAGFRSFEEIAELFYILDEPYWGKGLATEIAGECLRFGFEERGLNQIIAFTRPENAASRKVLDKINMRFDGEITVFGVEAVRYVFNREDYKR
ncbi:MAG: GNAT family N-acetyltransferase [Pyrinomonadaceae bacterium]|nr:GNAT family N-acetyltransferase [Pyrinomonadaceae bacterium]